MKSFIITIMLYCSLPCFAQDPTEDYFTFSQLANFGDSDKALLSAQKVLPLTDKLSEKRRVLFFDRLAKVYETKKDADSAIKYYEKVTALVPNYYVAHLALGYLYIKPANALAPKINSAKGNKALYDKYLFEYIRYIKKALPHLEKAYACDPNDQVMSLLVNFSRVLKLPSDEASIQKRTATFAASCVSLLSE